MTISENGLKFIKDHEGVKYNAYQCPAKKWTIGYGATYYENGDPVRKGDTVTKERALELLNWHCNQKSLPLQGITLNQNQFDALVSLIFNIGAGNFNSSTIRKKVIKNPNDPTIRTEFAKWKKIRDKGKLVDSNGLIFRRKQEAELYFKSI